MDDKAEDKVEDKAEASSKDEEKDEKPVSTSDRWTALAAANGPS